MPKESSTSTAHSILSRGACQPGHKVAAANGNLDRKQEITIIGIDSLEIRTLRDEYLRGLRGNDKPQSLRIGINSEGDSPLNTAVFQHGNCCQKSPSPVLDGCLVGLQATITLLEGVGYPVNVIDSGCCCLVRTFEYESEHFDLSMHLGDLSLILMVCRVSTDACISTAGFSFS